jgi:hypothetical protein
MADLRDVRLFEAALKFNGFPGESSLTWEIEMTPTTSYEEGDDYFVLEVEYSVHVRTPAEETDNRDPSDEVIASIDFRLAALYSLEIPEGKPNPTTAELDDYAKTMGMMAVYPYAREFVQNLTSRMGLPPLTLSTFRLPYPDTSSTPSEPTGATAKPPPKSGAKARKARPSRSRSSN